MLKFYHRNIKQLALIEDKFVDHVASKPFCMLFDLIGASDYLRFIPDTESLNSKL